MMMAATALSALRSLLPSCAPSPSDQIQNAYDLLDMVRAVVQCILSDILRNANIKKTPISTSVSVAIIMGK